MTLSLVAFGPPELTQDGRPAPAELTWRKHFALLVYLARSPGGTRQRDHLIGLLWPEKNEARARHSLNEACGAIRRSVGDAALETQGTAIVLDRELLHADWMDAEEALAARDARRLAALWRGEFLEGFGIPDASPFEDWLAAERNAWRTRFRDALTAEADRLMRAGHHREALEFGSRVLRADPGAEAALRVAMLSETLAGAAPAALGRFDAYASWLRAEQAAEPAADLAAVAERIRGGVRHHAPPETGAGTLVATPPLCGREHLLATIAAHFAPVDSPRVTVVLLGGGPGCGKSRLLREVVERARLEGGRLLAMTCVGADADAPGSAITALVRRGLARAAGLASASPDAVAVLAMLDPEIARRYPGAPARPATGSADLGRALGEALAAVAEEGPVMVAIDDAHLADHLSLDALPALLRAAERARLTVLLAARTDAAVPDGVTALRSRIGHDLAGVEVTVNPLGDPDVAELTRALLPAYGEDEQARLVRRLRREANGVPLFVVEILRALAGGASGGAALWPAAGETTAQPLPFPVPGAVIAALTLRVQSLTPPARETLLAASVAGTRVDPAIVARLLDTSSDDIEARFAELERTGFLRDDGGPYLFAAELVRVFIRSEMLTSGERRRLQQRLEALPKLNGDVRAQVRTDGR